MKFPGNETRRESSPVGEPAVRCPVCLADGAGFFAEADDRLFGLAPGRYELYRCGLCRCIFQHPMPDGAALGQFYPESYWWDEARQRPSGIARIIGSLEKVYREFVTLDHVRFLEHCAGEARESGRTVLDVGCGSGTFLHLAQRRGFTAHGLDFSAQAVALARRQYGLDVRQGDVGDDSWQGCKFDFITMFHVLEHLPEPRKALSFAIQHLKPGGSLIIQVPNAGSLQARIFGARWYGLDVPRHLINFTAAGLQRLLAEAGLEGKPVSRFSLRDNPAALASSLVPMLDPIGRKGRKIKTEAPAAALAEMGYFALVVAALPFTFLESALGSGATLWAHVKPREIG